MGCLLIYYRHQVVETLLLVLFKNIKYMLARDLSRAIGIACASGSIQVDCVHTAFLTSGDRPSTLIVMYFLYTSIYHIFALSFTIIRYHGIKDRDGSSEGAGFPATVMNTIIVMRACLQGVRSVLLITVFSVYA